jgi:hypothetical protein
MCGYCYFCAGYNNGYGTGMYGNSYGGMYGSSYGGAGGYSGGMYGNSSYRGGYGGMYNGGMYGGGLGGGPGGGLGGSLGGPMGGYGVGMGPCGDQDPNNPFGAPPSPPSFWVSFLQVVRDLSLFLSFFLLVVLALIYDHRPPPDQIPVRFVERKKFALNSIYMFLLGSILQLSL